MVGCVCRYTEEKGRKRGREGKNGSGGNEERKESVNVYLVTDERNVPIRTGKKESTEKTDVEKEMEKSNTPTDYANRYMILKMR